MGLSDLSKIILSHTVIDGRPWKLDLDPPSAAEKIVKGVKEMEMVRSRRLEEIKIWRDEMLVKLLNVLRKPR